MTETPDYRLRLFLSADLVGSTAFKAKKGYQEYDDGNVRPRWVDVFSDFYSEFPLMVQADFKNGQATLNGNGHEHAPKIWKTIGDEVILACKITTIEHVAYCVTCFLRCLAEYEQRLTDYSLGIKGNAWVAAFPAPNVSIRLKLDPTESDDLNTSEKFEKAADNNPHEFDFLGKAIDTGFRIARHSAYDRMTFSVQLAHILCKAKGNNQFSYDLEYRGREQLKGVNAGIPYPIVVVDTESNHGKKKLRTKEKTVTGEKPAENDELLEFLDQFMCVAGIEFPFINFRNKKLVPAEAPDSYKQFAGAYRAALTEAKKREEAIRASGENDPEDTVQLSDDDAIKMIEDIL